MNPTLLGSLQSLEKELRGRKELLNLICCGALWFMYLGQAGKMQKS